MLLKYSVGLDISQKKFHACLVSIDSNQRIKVLSSRKFDNTPGGFREFKKWYRSKHKEKGIQMHFCMEATGVYHEKLADYLHGIGERVSIVLANLSKKYLASLGLKTKNDSVDARGLAQMGAERELKSWSPPIAFYAKLRSLTRHYQMLQESRTIFSNRLHAITASLRSERISIKHLKQSLRQLDKQLSEVKSAIIAHLKEDDEVSRKINQICEIKGVGELTVSVIIAETYGFELFENAKQLISYTGYDVVENQSGKRQGRTKISKKGNSRIRRALHMPAFSVVRHKQTSFFKLYHRTFSKHHIKMKSYTAVQKKLLTTIFALWKNDQIFDNNYHEKYEIRKEVVAPINPELLQVQVI